MSTPLFDFVKTQTYSIKELNHDQAKRIQSLLKGCGYEIKVDGEVGPETTRVFGQFKEDNFLEHPTTLGVTTYNALIEESNKRQAPIKPSDETYPIDVDGRKAKTVTVAGIGKVKTSEKIAGFFTWGEATHDGTRPISNAEYADNVRRLALELSKFSKYLDLKDEQVRVTSWYRPEPHNSRAGGASNSQHLYGKAVDIAVPGMTGLQLAQKAVKFGWRGGIGVYQKYPHICHLDIGTKRKWGF